MFILDRFHQHPDILTPDKMCFLPRPQYFLPPSRPSSALESSEIAGRQGEKEEVGVGESERENTAWMW